MAAVPDLICSRLANQRLVGAGLRRAADVVREQGAVQAQDFAGAKWALSMRARDATDAEVEAEFARGAILRTHVMRPTWHFVALGDLRWLLALTAPQVNARMATYDRRMGLTAAVFRRALDVIGMALDGGRYLMWSELKTALERARVRVPSVQHLAHIMMRAELDAIVTSGPRRGKQFTYALLDERVPRTPSRERDEALLDLTGRYFATRGPATAQDFGWWSGFTMSDARRGIDMAGRTLQHGTLGGRDYWWAHRKLPRRAPTAHLLPNYDEYFIGYKDRSAIGNRMGDVARVTGGNALIQNVVFVDGQLVGGWRRRVVRGRDVAELDLRVRVTASERRRIGEQVERFMRFATGKRGAAK